MKDYDIILFDLDGTLTDPGEGITKSVAHALFRFGIEVEDRRTLYPFIGPPLRDSFSHYYGMSPEDAERAVTYYREYYNDTGIYENLLYEGMRELLEKLQKSGKTMALATSKPEIFAKLILQYFEIDQYFTFVAGAHLDGGRSVKSDIIAYALESLGEVDRRKVLMIGDREYDVLGAKAQGVDVLGVLYGYGSKEELETAGATYIAPSVADIAPLLL